MVKSGRLRGFVENRHIYDSDSAGLLVLRCAFAVYALYAFDTPMNKTPRSDFCGDEYLLGAAVSGISSLDNEQPKLSDIGGALVKTLSENKKTAAGKTDFLALYDSIFNGLLDKYPHSGCQLTVEFLEKHSAAADRDIMRKGLEPEIFAMWVESSTEPQLAPVHSAGRKKALSISSQTACFRQILRFATLLRAYSTGAKTAAEHTAETDGKCQVLTK